VAGGFTTSAVEVLAVGAGAWLGLRANTVLRGARLAAAGRHVGVWARACWFMRVASKQAAFQQIDGPAIQKVRYGCIVRGMQMMRWV